MLEDILNSYDSVFLETSLVASGEIPRNWLKSRWDSTDPNEQILLVI